jgi:uncharacterized protein (TIGR03437 family)
VLQTFDGSPRLSPGTWVQIFGTNLAGTARTWGARDFNGPQAPTSPDGVSVRINGKAGYISAISPEKITVQVHDEDTVGGPVPIEVTREGGTSNRVTIEISKVSPALRTTPSFLVSGKQ